MPGSEVVIEWHLIALLSGMLLSAMMVFELSDDYDDDEEEDDDV